MPAYNPYRLWEGTWIPTWLLIRSEVSPGAKLVFGRLCRYAGEEGTACPSQTTLSMEIGMHRASVIRFLQELEELKLIEGRTEGRRRRYTFLSHPWMRSDVSQEVTQPTVSEQQAVTDKPKGPNPQITEVVLYYQEQIGAQMDAKVRFAVSATLKKWTVEQVKAAIDAWRKDISTKTWAQQRRFQPPSTWFYRQAPEYLQRLHPPEKPAETDPEQDRLNAWLATDEGMAKYRAKLFDIIEDMYDPRPWVEIRKGLSDADRERCETVAGRTLTFGG